MLSMPLDVSVLNVASERFEVRQCRRELARYQRLRFQAQALRYEMLSCARFLIALGFI